MDERLFAKRLQAVIDRDENLTVAGLSVKAGLDNSALRSLLSGRVKNPRIDTAMKVCAALGTSLEEFMAGEFEPARLAEDLDRIRIRALLSDLSHQERQLLLTYAEGLRDARDTAQKQSQSDGQ